MYAHAYVANEPLLQWLAVTEPMDPCIPMANEHGHALDTAMANQPAMYALCPMIATQRVVGGARVDAHRDERGKRRSLFDAARYQYFGRHYGMRLFETSAILLSPLNSVLLEKHRAASGLAFAHEAQSNKQLFNGKFYLDQYPDVAKAGFGALFHFLMAGSDHGNRPHPLFDTHFYRTKYRDVASSGLKPLTHFLEIGAKEGRTPHVLFDADWYRNSYRGELDGRTDLFHHFMTIGQRKGFNPNSMFDTQWYLARYRDVDQSGLTALEHYIWLGTRRGFSPSVHFDGPKYWASNPDVAATGVNPLEHYLKHGQFEGRKFEPLV